MLLERKKLVNKKTLSTRGDFFARPNFRSAKGFSESRAV
jgi:hypothetical protein